jgi:MHS family proline/betaine transporter-like MFS transporter
MSNTKSLRRTNIATLIGTVLEQHDFIVYAHLLPIVSASCFFSGDSASTSVHKGFLSFAVGYLFRPLGGLIFGHFGDRFGRKGAMIVSISLMSIPTFMIGVLPGYSQIGIASGLILYILRGLQSFSVGGELSGAGTVLVENASLNRKYFAASVLHMAAFSGGMFGAISGFFFTRPFMPSWGWRLAFLFGSLIAFVGLYLRSKAVETPEFALILQQKKVLKSPVIDTLKKDWFSHICYVGMVASSSGVNSYIIVYIPMIMKTKFGYDVSGSLLVTICFYGLILFSLPFFGLLADKVGGKKVIATGNVLVALIVPFAMRAMEFDTPGYFFLFQGMACVAFATECAPLSIITKYMYPTERRYSGSSFGLGLGAAIVGGFTPLALSFLQKQSGTFWGPSIFIICCQIFALLGLYFAPSFLKKTD